MGGVERSYTDFDSEMGKSMIKTSIMPKLFVLFAAFIVESSSSPEKYLTADKFIRPYMDVEGYFPIYLLLYIPAIQQFGVDAGMCIATFLQDAPFAEVDMSRMTVRPKQNWVKVLV